MVVRMIPKSGHRFSDKIMRKIIWSPFLRRSRLVSHLALAGALVAALGLGACGRKGPLDPPPGASLVGEPQANMPDLMSDKGKPPPAAGAEAVQPAKKHIPLDVLLN